MSRETPAAGTVPASRPALAASAVAALTAAVALAGWAVPAFAADAPGFGMAPLNAVAVLLLAVALAAVTAQGRGTGRSALATAATLGAAAVAVAALALDLLGGRELPVGRIAADAQRTAAWPAGLPAASVLASALALRLAHRGALPGLVHLLAGAVAALALQSLVASAYGSLALGPSTSRGIALAAAVSLLALAGGIELLRPGHGLAGLWAAPGAAGFAARRLLPAAVLVPVAAGWLALLGRRAGLYGATVALSLAIVASIVVLWVVIALGTRSIERLDARRARAERARERALRLEQRSRRAAERRLREETALRRVAQTLAGAFDLRSILQATAETAIEAVQADGVYVERMHGRDEVEVAVAAGWGAPPLGTRVPYPGSLTEEVVRSRHTEILEDIVLERRRISRHLARSCGRCRTLIAPLFSEDEPAGALVLLRRTDRSAFTQDEIARVELLASIASFALRRGLLVAEVDRRRREAEAGWQRFRSLFELNPDAVFSLDPRGRCTSANPAAEALTGFSANELTGAVFTGVVPPGLRTRAWRAFYNALRGVPQRIELEVRPRNGGRREVRVGLVPMIEHGRAVGVFGVAEDVTARRRAERALRAARAEAERRARQESALRRAAETVATAFTDEKIIDAIVEGALTATGADGAFVERIVDGAKDLVVVSATGEWTPEIGARRPYAGSFGEAVLLRGTPVAVERAREAGRPLTPGFAERCGDCGLLGVPLVDAGQTIGVLLLVRAPERPPFTPEQHARALTYSRLASLAFRKVHLFADSERRREELEHVLESRSRLISGFSHDVKNPIGAADGHAALLEDGSLGDLDERQLDGVRRIRRSLRSALDLIDDLVSLARTETGEPEIVRKPTDVRIIAHELAEEYRAQAEAGGLDIEVVPPPALQPIPVDPDRVRQILGNLVSNAVKYTPAGGRITLRVTARDSGPRGEAGRWIAVDVTDTGPGIPESKQEEIFREFTRLEPDETAGAGLGLSISRRLARAMGGDVTVHSVPGRGSTFTLWLPAAGAAERVRRGEAVRPRTELAGVPHEEQPRRLRAGASAPQSPPHEASADRDERPAPASVANLHEILVHRVRDVAIFAIDTEGRILTWNDGAERLTGRSAGEVLGRHVSMLHTPEQIARGEVERGLRVAARRGHLACEGWRVRKDGSRFWACTSITPLRDRTGRLIGYAKVVSDLTDRKREEDRQRFLADASRELAASLDHRATLGRIARLAVPRVADIAAVYTFEDHQPTRLERVEADPQIMRTLREIERRYPGEAERVQPLIEVARQRGPSLIDVTEDHLRSSALDAGHLALLRQLQMRSIMVLPLEARGRLLGVIVLVAAAARAPYTESDLAFGESLARRAALAVDNARLYEAALLANRARSDFLAVMSHELRTPLNAIVGYADLLLMGVPEPPPPAAREQILRIIASARHLRELIEDILSYSRIEAGRQQVTLAPTDLRRTLGRVARTAAPLAAEKELRFHYEPPDERLLIETDEAKVRQLLLYLLANAVKFTDRGEIRLSARVEADQVVVEVTDTGIGIAPEDLERVFEPFWQVEQGMTRRTPGTGLGLTLARRLARLLGGDITVASEPGRGSTFTVRLPARAEQQQAEAA